MFYYYCSQKKRAPVKPKLSFKVSCFLRQHYLVQVRWVSSQNKKSLPILILIKHPKETYDNTVEKIMPARKMCKNQLFFM